MILQLVSTISDSFIDFDLDFIFFSIDNSNINQDNFLPIEFYIDNLVGYVESTDPLGDNWQDCGSDSDCSLKMKMELKVMVFGILVRDMRKIKF